MDASNITPDRVAELSAFHLEHARWPHHNVPGELSLYEWLGGERRRTKLGAKVSAAQAARLDRLDCVLPGWSLRPDHDINVRKSTGFTWKERADELGVFLFENSRWPRYRDRAERSLNSWLTLQRVDALAGNAAFTDERRLYLDSVVPGWPGKIPADFNWEARAYAVAEFVRSNGRWPRLDAANERPLREWISVTRQGEKGRRSWFTAERKAYLKKVFPEWSAGPQIR